MKLTENVRSNRFADGPKRPINAASIAAKVVLAFGGRVDAGASLPVEDAARATDEASVVLADEQGLQAALVHLLRLIGIGNACNGACAQQPVLRVEQDQDAQCLRLHFTSEGNPEAPIPTERVDYRLMLKAVERIARESDGTLVLGEDHATFELPLLHAEQ